VSQHSVSLEKGCAERRVVALAGDFTMANRNQIPQLWTTYFQAGAEIEAAVEGAMYGVSFGADGHGNFRYGVGVEVSAEPLSLPDGFCLISLSAGDYAVLRAFGPVTKLPAMFDGLFERWIPENGFVPAPGAVFERYPSSDRNGPEAMEYEIWAPVTTRP